MTDWYYGSLLALLLTASWFDIKSRKVPNQLILVGILVGVVANAWMGTSERFSFALYGLLLGFCIPIIPYALNWIGAGDVKLFSVVGLFLGPEGIIDAAIYTALCGGVLALYYVIKMRFITNIYKVPFAHTMNKPTLPYVLAITGGALMTIFLADNLV